METVDVMEIDDGGEESAANVCHDKLGRGHGEALPLPSSGVDLKYRERERGLDESSADVADHLDDKGLKRKKQRRAKPNKRPILPVVPAPNNTTQFIMEDHTDLQSLDLHITARARDSSFSIDSEEDLSSSPEDEAYLSKEFANTYEDVHVERLGTMSKVDLIQEYLQLEQRVDTLEKKLNTSSGGHGGTGTDSDSEAAEEEMPMDPATAEKIRIFQEEIKKLVEENEQLAQENQRLQSSGSLVRPSSSLSSSVDSESDSSTSSGSSSSGSSGRSSRSSQSSRHSNGNDVTPKLSCPEKGAGVEMDFSRQETEVLEFSCNGQDIRNETSKEDQVLTDCLHQDSMVASSVIAH